VQAELIAHGEQELALLVPDDEAKDASEATDQIAAKTPIGGEQERRVVLEGRRDSGDLRKVAAIIQVAGNEHRRSAVTRHGWARRGLGSKD
jgi:hypothetical protein